MKKQFITAISLITAVTFSACGKSGTTSHDTDTESVEITQNSESEPKATSKSSKSNKDKKDTGTNEYFGTTDIAPCKTYEDIETNVQADVEGTVNALNQELADLSSDIDTFDKYVQKEDEIDAFYDMVLREESLLLIRLRKYSIEYAYLVIDREDSYRDMYESIEDMYDVIYDDAGDDVYDGIYDDLFDDIYDTYYDGILSDAYEEEDLDYSEWSSVHSEEYKKWSRTHSDVYEQWSDFHSDVYDFWSDMRSEFYGEDLERAQKKIDDFYEDIDKLTSKLDNTASAGAVAIAEDEDSEEQTEEEPQLVETSTSSEDLVDGMRPEFKEAMDAYEEFYDEYFDFMKKYMDNPSDLSLLTEYMEFLGQIDEVEKKFDAWDDEDLNTAEASYYLDVATRISKKSLEFAQ